MENPPSTDARPQPQPPRSTCADWNCSNLTVRIMQTTADSLLAWRRGGARRQALYIVFPNQGFCFIRCAAMAAKAGRVRGSLAALAAMGWEAKRTITIFAAGST